MSYGPLLILIALATRIALATPTDRLTGETMVSVGGYLDNSLMLPLVDRAKEGPLHFLRERLLLLLPPQNRQMPTGVALQRHFGPR